MGKTYNTYVGRLMDRIKDMVVGRIDDRRIMMEYYRRSSGGIDWRRQAETERARTLEDWKRALAAATDPDDPRRGDLMRFYRNMLYDNHLSSTIDNRILPVQCAPFKLVDTEGNEDMEAHRLLEKPWYLELVRLICSSVFEGTKLIELFDVNDKMELSGVDEIPQSNFIPQRGIVIREEWDNEGVSYREGAYKDYYIQVGGDWSLGMLNQLAIIVIAKKLGIGSWLNFIDRFGVPPIFAITDRLDPTRRNELFDMLSEFHQNHFAVMQGNERIEIPNGYNVDAHNTFKALITDVANTEISKRILGATGMTDEKSFVGSAEVSERLYKFRVQVDKLMFKYYFNEEVKPRLVKLSPVYAPLDNLTFEYDESETMTVKEMIEAIKSLSAYYIFDVEEVAKITGLPVTEVRNAFGGTGAEEGNMTGTQKKKPDRKKAVNAGGVPVMLGTGNAMKAAEKLKKGGCLPEDLDRDCVMETYRELVKMVQYAWGEEYYTHPMAYRIRANIMKFAGAKTYQYLNELSRMTGNGDYEGLAKKKAELYNGAWLEAEKAYVANAANSARDWRKYRQDQDIYRNLRYHTMEDDSVRQEHRALDGTVRPVKDSFWSTYTPPNGFGCRCWLEQTNAPVTEAPELPIDERFRGNPGEKGEIFNRKTPYFDIDRNLAPEVNRNRELLKLEFPYTKLEKAGKGNVYVSDFADPKDFEENLKAARMLAEKLQENVYIRPHIYVDGGKNPELAIGSPDIWADLKNYKAVAKGMEVPVGNFIKNQLASANNQKCRIAVFNLAEEPIPDFETGITKALIGNMNGINLNIREVIIIRNGQTVRIPREDIEARNIDRWWEGLV